jgi:hypothetical protein
MRRLWALLLLVGCAKQYSLKPSVSVTETIDGQPSTPAFSRAALFSSWSKSGRSESLAIQAEAHKVDPPAAFKAFSSYRARVAAQLGATEAAAEAGGMDLSPRVAAAKALTDASRAVAEKLFGAEPKKEDPVPYFSRLPEDKALYGVVIGVEKYSDLPPASYAERDADAVARWLLASGMPERNLIRLSGSRALRSSLEKYLEDWLPKADPGARVFVYFSGHGAPKPETGEAYLLPWDGDPAYLERTGYPLSRLYASLGKLKAKQVVVALDACFSGAGGRSVLPKGARPLVTTAAPVSVPPSLTVLAAAGPSQITGAFDEKQHGLFTYWLLKGLEGAARDKDGVVSARSLHAYVAPKVADGARRQHREQTPVLMGPDAKLALIDHKD